MDSVVSEGLGSPYPLGFVLTLGWKITSYDVLTGH